MGDGGTGSSATHDDDTHAFLAVSGIANGSDPDGFGDRQSARHQRAQSPSAMRRHACARMQLFWGRHSWLPEPQPSESFPRSGSIRIRRSSTERRPRRKALPPRKLLTVTGLYPTTTAITATGNPSGYGLTATVVGFRESIRRCWQARCLFRTRAPTTSFWEPPLGAPTFAESLIPAPGSPIQTGNSPAIAGVGDFNEDGIPDLAIENAGDNTISILLGKGDGTFLAAAAIPAIGTPPCETISLQSNCAIVVGDFNDDGHADLAVTSGNDNTVVILQGNGQGTFTPFSGSPDHRGQFPGSCKNRRFQQRRNSGSGSR